MHRGVDAFGEALDNGLAQCGDAIAGARRDGDVAGKVVQRAVLLEQAEMILRASEESVPEAADRGDVRRRYDAVRLLDSSTTDG